MRLFEAGQAPTTLNDASSATLQARGYGVRVPLAPPSASCRVMCRDTVDSASDIVASGRLFGWALWDSPSPKTNLSPRRLFQLIMGPAPLDPPRTGRRRDGC